MNEYFTIDLSVEMECEFPFEVDLEYGECTGIGPKSYKNLDDLPKLDGRLIIGDIQELDPTVPAWAKAPTKPEYKANEVGAVPEGTIRILDDGAFWEMLERE